VNLHPYPATGRPWPLGANTWTRRLGQGQLAPEHGNHLPQVRPFQGNGVLRVPTNQSNIMGEDVCIGRARSQALFTITGAQRLAVP
jgi:hypothetical protein